MFDISYDDLTCLELDCQVQLLRATLRKLLDMHAMDRLIRYMPKAQRQAMRKRWKWQAKVMWKNAAKAYRDASGLQEERLD